VSNSTVLVVARYNKLCQQAHRAGVMQPEESTEGTRHPLWQVNQVAEAGPRTVPRASERNGFVLILRTNLVASRGKLW
jgi:hypothetical protein